MKKEAVLGLVMIGLASTSFGKGSVGENITRFELEGCPLMTQWYNGFIDSFFTNRIDIGPTIFPREYLTISDMWLNDALYDGMIIQQFHRQRLIDDMMDDEGYVMTQQHGASSHDHGWPFPHWVQVPLEEGFRDVTAGWHFYDNKQGWEICYDMVQESAPGHLGEAATKKWSTQGVKSLGINQQRNAWELKVTGQPVLTSPAGVYLDPFNCPYIQIRWYGDCQGGYMEWTREGETNWNASSRAVFTADWIDGTGRSESTGMFHSIIPLSEYPSWNGKVTRIRFVFGDMNQGEPLLVRSIFTHWDTRHLVNNAIYVKAAYDYFRWTGDFSFLKAQMPKLRKAMRYMIREGHVEELGHIRCTWHGHDARPGYTVRADGSKIFHVGHGKGGNYWDLLPFGWDDMYTTTHCYAALLAMEQLEGVVRIRKSCVRLPLGSNRPLMKSSGTKKPDGLSVPLMPIGFFTTTALPSLISKRSITAWHLKSMHAALWSGSAVNVLLKAILRQVPIFMRIG